MNQTSNLKSDRESGLELLRIIAMIMVLGLHVNFAAIGNPTAFDIESNPTSGWFRILFQSLCIVSVNVFILISGYFSIKLKLKTLLNFCFILLFWRIGCAIILLLLQNISFLPFQLPSTKYILINLIPCFGDWFSLSYLILILLAPALNIFIERTSTKLLIFWLAILYTIALIFTFLPQTLGYFSNSPLYLLCIYAIGRIISRFRINNIQPLKCIIIYILCTILTSMLSYIVCKYNIPTLNTRIFSYLSPITLLSSIALFFLFKNMTFKNKQINRIASHTFSIYIIHCNPLVFPFFLYYAYIIYYHFKTLEYTVVIAAYITGVFLFCVLCDIIRKYIWDRLAPHIISIANHLTN